MYSALHLTALLSAAGVALADVFAIEAGLLPTSTRPNALMERDPDYQCASSVYTELLTGPTPESQDFIDWLAVEPDAAECTVTAPASLSSAYTSWFNELTEFAEGIEDRAAKQTDCGFDPFTIEFTGFCQEPKRTVYFTGESSNDPTETLVQDKLPIPTGVEVGAASRSSGVAGVGMALAAFVALALTL